MMEQVSSEYIKSNTQRADRRQAAVESCWDKGESRGRRGGWVDEERGRKGRDERERRCQREEREQMDRLIYSKKGDGGLRLRLGK